MSPTSQQQVQGEHFLAFRSFPFPAWKPQLERGARSSVTKGIPRLWRIKSNKQRQKRQRIFPRAKVQRWSSSGKTHGKQRRSDILLGWRAHMAYIPDRFISGHWRHDGIVFAQVTLSSSFTQPVRLCKWRNPFALRSVKVQSSLLIMEIIKCSSLWIM